MAFWSMPMAPHSRRSRTFPPIIPTNFSTEPNACLARRGFPLQSPRPEHDVVRKPLTLFGIMLWARW
ncbi:hypothetical protein GFL84_07225 [Rhizobium leguminosarum bv. viciae]|nr:hypothetical protein [Rhizobium leguminosarum bv. viciae]